MNLHKTSGGRDASGSAPSQHSKLRRSIIVPAYKEAPIIGESLQALAQFLVEQHWQRDTEVIVVTADSADDTAKIVGDHAKQFQHFQFIEPGKRVGKGRDVKAGMRAARGELVIFTDADLATPLHYIPSMFDLLEQNGGMVIGVRSIKQMHITFMRRWSSLFSNWIVRLAIGLNVPDSQCGFKGFDQLALDTILRRSRIQGWGFDFEFIKIVRLHKLPLTFLPVPLWHDPKPEGTGLAGDSQFAAMKQAFSELLTVKKNQWKGYYK